MARTIRYMEAEGQEQHDEATDFSYSDEPMVDYGDDAEPRCSSCGELLAWHDGSCEVEPVSVADEVEVTIAVPAAGPVFAYEVGGLVVPAPAAKARVVVWRGQLRERHPGTGLVQRVPVYRLDDGYWDCYREEELRAA